MRASPPSIMANIKNYGRRKLSKLAFLPTIRKSVSCCKILELLLLIWGILFLLEDQRQSVGKILSVVVVGFARIWGNPSEHVRKLLLAYQGSSEQKHNGKVQQARLHCGQTHWMALVASTARWSSETAFASGSRPELRTHSWCERRRQHQWNTRTQSHQSCARCLHSHTKQHLSEGRSCRSYCGPSAFDCCPPQWTKNAMHSTWETTTKLGDFQSKNHTEKFQHHSPTVPIFIFWKAQKWRSPPHLDMELHGLSFRQRSALR